MSQRGSEYVGPFTLEEGSWSWRMYQAYSNLHLLYPFSILKCFQLSGTVCHLVNGLSLHWSWPCLLEWLHGLRQFPSTLVGNTPSGPTSNLPNWNC